MAGVTDIRLSQIILAVSVRIRSGLEVRGIRMAGRTASDAWQFEMSSMLAAGWCTMTNIRDLVGVAGCAGNAAGAGNGILDICQRCRTTPVIIMAVRTCIG